MNNIIFKLAYSSFKKEKKQYLISMVVMILSFTIIIAFFNTLKNDQIISQKMREKLYGNWNICYEDIDDESLKLIKNIKDYKSITDVELIDVTSSNERIANYNESFFQLASIKLTGHIPQSNDEIIVKKHIGKIGETINLTINDQFKQFKIVGVINDYDQKWCMDAYTYFTYQLTPIHHQTYIKAKIRTYLQNDTHYIFNTFLEDSITEFSIQYQFFNHESFMNEYQYEIGNTDYQTSIDIVLVFAVIGLLIGISYTMTQRKERLFLLKSLGMTNRQMLTYIFYETICLVVFSLIVSFGLGFILSWLMSLMISCLTDKYYFSFHLGSLISYLGILVLMILVITFFSYMIISLQSLDSLIYRKRRTKLKKYNKAIKMSVFHLTNIEIKHHAGIFLSVIILSVSILVTLTSLIDYSRFTFFKSFYDIYNHDLYEYQMKINHQINFDKNIIQEHIDEYMYSTMYSLEDDIGQSHYRVVDEEKGYGGIEIPAITLVGYEKTQLDNQFVIYQGRLPENKDECICTGNGSYSTIYEDNKEIREYDFDYQVGDKISLINQGNQSKVEYTVVGQVISKEDEIDPMSFEYDIANNSLMVLKDSIQQENWSFFYIFYDEKDLQFYFNRNVDNFTLYKHFISQTYTSTLLKELLYNIGIFIIEIVFLVLILKIFIERMMKDLKLLRCLGMTNRQILQMNLCILGYCLLNIAGIYSLFVFMGSMDVKYMLIFISYAIMMSFIFLMIIYRNLKKGFIFLPSDVHRYY